MEGGYRYCWYTSIDVEELLMCYNGGAKSVNMLLEVISYKSILIAFISKIKQKCHPLCHLLHLNSKSGLRSWWQINAPSHYCQHRPTGVKIKYLHAKQCKAGKATWNSPHQAHQWGQCQ